MSSTTKSSHRLTKPFTTMPYNIPPHPSWNPQPHNHINHSFVSLHDPISLIDSHRIAMFTRFAAATKVTEAEGVANHLQREVERLFAVARLPDHSRAGRERTIEKGIEAWKMLEVCERDVEFLEMKAFGSRDDAESGDLDVALATPTKKGKKSRKSKMH
ncbi:hypothetical protein E4T47_05064 [Aureobasidium subglaciale]|nr:hypothetical protein E4T47_05064 [Aureobasidium subglaciale]